MKHKKFDLIAVALNTDYGRDIKIGDICKARQHNFGFELLPFRNKNFPEGLYFHAKEVKILIDLSKLEKLVWGI